MGVPPAAGPGTASGGKGGAGSGGKGAVRDDCDANSTGVDPL